MLKLGVIEILPALIIQLIEREVGVKPKIAFTVTSLSNTIFAGYQKKTDSATM